MVDFKDSLLRDIFNLKKTVHSESISKVGDPEAISLFNLLKLIGVLKHQRLEMGHSSSGILSESLVNRNGNIFIDLQTAAHQVSFKNFLNEILTPPFLSSIEKDNR